MITDNFNKIASPGIVAVTIAFLVSVVAFGFLKDVIVFILTKLYEFFIQHKLG